MAKRTRTVLQLLADLAFEVEMDAFGASTYVTKTQAITLLSKSLHAFSLQHQAFGLLAATGTINAASGTKAYNLPDDFACLLNLTYLNSGERYKLERCDLDEIDLEPATPGGWQGGCGRYCILGEQLLVTDPRASFTVQIRYVPELPAYNTGGTAIADLSADTDYVLCKSAIDEWIVLDSAIKVLDRQEKDPSSLVRRKAELEETLRASVIERDAREGGQVRNTWGRETIEEGGWR